MTTAMTFENGLSITTGPRIRRLPLESLFVDPKYQRPLNDLRVARMAQGFDPRQLGILEVSQRDGENSAVFDGQHRLAMLRKLGAKDVLCLVHQGLTPADEAYLFAHLQLDRKQLKPYERFHAQLVAGEPEQVAIDKAVKAEGLEVANRGGDPTTIAAVVVIEMIYRRGGTKHLREVLSFVRNLWDGDHGVTDGALLQGVSIFLSAFGPKIGDKNRTKLSRVGPVVLMRRSAAYASSSKRMAYGPGVAMELRKIAGMARSAPVRYTKVFGPAVKFQQRKQATAPTEAREEQQTDAS